MNTPSEEKVSSGVKDGSSAGEVTQGVTRGGGRVRRATFADLDAILDINDNIYDGLDYMPAYFYIFMHFKNYAMYVFELDGQLVGYGISSPSVILMCMCIPHLHRLVALTLGNFELIDSLIE